MGMGPIRILAAKLAVCHSNHVLWRVLRLSFPLPYLYSSTTVLECYLKHLSFSSAHLDQFQEDRGLLDDGAAHASIPCLAEAFLERVEENKRRYLKHLHFSFCALMQAGRRAGEGRGGRSK